MKKLISLLLILCMSLFLVSTISAWGANRVISGNQVTINIDDTGSASGIFTLQETLTGATVTTYPSNCGLAGNVLTCDSDSVSQRTIVYQTSGSGSVSGVIAEGVTPGTQTITGNTQITPATSAQIKINEFESNPVGTDTGNEWVELYNPTANAVNLNGWDLVNADGDIYTISSQTISANGYLVITFSGSWLDNTDEYVLIRDGSDVEVDRTATFAESTESVSTWQRIPNGQDTNNVNDWQFVAGTKGVANVVGGSDTTPPQISAVSVTPSTTTATVTWTTNENSGSVVYYGLTTGLGSIANGNTNTLSHTTSLSSLTASTNYYYKVGSCDASGNCANSTTSTFITTAVPVTAANDLMVNYVRGKILVNSAPVAAGTRFTITVLDGLNMGQNYSGTVDDSNIPNALKGRGYFDTRDRTIFSTGARFRVSSLDYVGTTIDGTFVNGGNGTFEPEADLITLNVGLNRAPIYNNGLSTGVGLNEDSSVIYNLTDYFSDPDGNPITYSLVGIPTNLNVAFAGSIMTVSSKPANWNGRQNFTIRASDGTISINQELEAIVNNIPDAPILASIANITLDEGRLVQIKATATDVDGSPLVFEINDARFTDNGNGNFTWQTTYADNGTYNVMISVTDDTLLSDSQEVRIIINNANQPPVMNVMAPITIDEDSGYQTFNDRLQATDDSGIISRYEISGENRSQVDCTISDTVLGVLPVVNFSGTATCKIKVYDAQNAFDEEILTINVNNINDVPTLLTASPTYSPVLMHIRESKPFSVTWADVDNTNAQVLVSWYFDDVLQTNGDTYTLTQPVAGSHVVRVTISDGIAGIEKVWNINAIDRPFTNKYDGDTTNFTEVADISCINNLVLERTGHGKIEFLDNCIDLSSVADIDTPSEIWQGLIGVDTNILTTLVGKRARLSFYNIGSTITPGIYRNSLFTRDVAQVNALCDSGICSNVSYSSSSRTLVFNINSFSTFVAGSSPTCSQQSGFLCTGKEICRGTTIESSSSGTCCSMQCTPSLGDLDVCKQINNGIVIDIKDPDEDDEFDVADKIEVEVEIENNLVDDKHFDVLVSLYDATDDDSLVDEKDSLSIDSDEDEDATFTLDIPEDAEESHSFYIYVKAEDDDNELDCNEKMIKVDIQRPDDYLVVDNIDIAQDVAVCQENVLVDVLVKNLGSDEQEDVYISLENNLLGINKKSGKFDIEEYDEDDEYLHTFSVQMPVNATKGTYNLIATVYYGNEKATGTAELVLGECQKQIISSKVIYLKDIPDEDVQKLIVSSKTTTDKYVQRLVSRPKKEIVEEEESLWDDFINSLASKDYSIETCSGKIIPSCDVMLIFDAFLVFCIIIIFLLILFVALANTRRRR